MEIVTSEQAALSLEDCNSITIGSTFFMILEASCVTVLVRSDPRNTFTSVGKLKTRKL